jgi:TatD DNase family protein
MDWVYQYRDPECLYLNVTNRCSNRCGFCVRNDTVRLGNGMLSGAAEPECEELLAAVDGLGGAQCFREIIWCGFGEPTFRLDLILEASPVFREAGASVRLNTNGHACLIHGRDVMPMLGGVVDRVNVSLNAPDPRRYVELCQPDCTAVLSGQPAEAEDFWHATVDFVRRAPSFFAEVQASVVGFVLTPREIAECRSIAGAAAFRVR